MNPLFVAHKHYGSLLLLLILIVVLVALFKGPNTKLQRIVAVLVDINLPGLDGYEVVTRLRGQPGLAGVPASQISVCPLCTVEEALLFHSWRRDQVKAVQWSGIVSQQLPD